jgi:pimeloyl-ACP methyl ester carboxylesterase
MRPLVILHGYSDTSSSFQPLANALANALGTNAQAIVVSLGDYVTLNDYVSFPDLLAALDEAWTEHQLPRDEGAVDMVVHSTGALVVRQWLQWLANRGPVPEPCPIKNLCMLAPANFGSPLAHKGQSFIGRVIKGSKSNADGPLQSGKYILKGLELGSPYTWNLAMQDRFVPDADQLFKKGRCLCTVLVGNQGYDGLAAMANENGGDGTVRVSTANMTCARLTIDFSEDAQNPMFQMQESTGKTAFGFLQRYNHSTITYDDTPQRLRAPLLDKIVRALTVTDADFDQWCDELDGVTEETTARQDAYQNMVFHCVDNRGWWGGGARSVQDFIVEFFENEEDGGPLAKFFHTSVLENVHNYTDDASYRSLYVNTSLLLKRIDAEGETLLISVSAHPQFSETHQRVGYKTFTDDHIGSLGIAADNIRDYFKPHRTLLVTVRLKWHRGRLFTYRHSTDPFQQV